ncbi:hypothetical protein VNO77_01886 [Canavalia gladiata]|uniref:Uncharacterized protein n=1 Tax=Canavalia gladiata TaxID=3824 RepID=A0AAN9MYF5_CANGL
MPRFSLNLHTFPPCLQIPQPLHIIANPLQRPKPHKINTLACQTKPNLDDSSATEKSVSELSSMKGTSSPKGAPPKFPSKDIKKKIATVSFLAALGLFLYTRFNFGVSFRDHCAIALPYEEALPNGKPTVVEFYED